MERYSVYTPAVRFSDAFKAGRWVMFNEVVIDLFLGRKVTCLVVAVQLLRT